MKKAKLLALIPIIFFSVSGGPYGLEEIISSLGTQLTLTLLVLIPLLWTIPECLIVATLSSNFPIQGGYYKWVQISMGNFWGFMEGYWSIIYNLIDISIYPILFTTYLKLLLPEISGHTEYAIQLLVIWLSVIINIKGIKVVGKSLGIFKLFILLAFIMFIFLGLTYLNFNFSNLQVNNHTNQNNHLIYGISLAFWNYIGWTNATPALEEMHESENNYYKAVFITIPIIVFFYILPVIIGICINPDASSWRFGEFTKIANMMGYKTLGTIITIGGMLMCLGIFNSLLLSSTRILSTMAEDKLLPKTLGAVCENNLTPKSAIILSGIIYSILIKINLDKLIVFDVFFYLLTILLEVIALIIFKKRDLLNKDRFTIPFGNIGLIISCTLSTITIITMLAYTIYDTGKQSNLLIPIILILAGIPIYKTITKLNYDSEISRS